MTNYSGDSQLGMPPGFRFHPTDEELVMHYLIRKCASQTISVPIIADIDLYKFDPWQLPEMALYGEKEWYFFSPRDRKYPNGSRPNRAAGAGYWKATGADKAIGKPKAVGIKKALVFYAGRSPNGVKTNWIMHEYRLANVDRSAGKKTGKDNLRLDDWVLCRIYNKKGKVEKYNVASQQQLSEIPEYEDTKPKLTLKRTAMPLQTQPSRLEDTSMVDELLRFDCNDSVPSQLLTNSSGSWHGDSSDVTCEKEVQSRPKNDFGNGLGFDQFDYFGAFSNDPFEPEMQFQPGEFYLDMFM